MDEKIKEALELAYTGEAKAALRLSVYAKKAEQEGFPQLARLFRAISFSESIHGERALRVLKEIGDTQENLRASFESETKVAHVAYDAFIRMALSAGDQAAAVHFTQSRDVEDTHARLYAAALDSLMEEKDVAYYVCPVCGYVAENAAPDECPVCGAKKEKFIHAA